MANSGTHRLQRQTSKRRHLFWRGLIVLAVGIALVALVLVIAVFHRQLPPTVQIDPAAAARLDAKLKEVELARPGGSPRVLQADETELNSYIDSRLRSASVVADGSSTALKDMKLKLFGDRAKMYVLLSVSGKDVSLELEGKLRTESRYLRLDPSAGKIGALPIPKSALESSMQDMMNSPESRAALRLPDNIEDVRVEDGKLVATFK